MRLAEPLAPVTDTVAGYKSFCDRVAARAAGRCEGDIHPLCPGLGSEVHHRWMRSQGGPDTLENCRLLCIYCHAWIHRSNVDWSRRHLWLISAGHPLSEPVRCGTNCTEDHREEVPA
jgi:hypothetical protein